MNYFLDEAQRKATGSTCFFEFQKGKFRNKFWLKDSLCLHADTFDSFMLYELFSKSIEEFCYYAPNEVNNKQWNNIVEKSKENEQWKNGVFTYCFVNAVKNNRTLREVKSEIFMLYLFILEFPVLSFPRHETSENLLGLAEPQFPHLKDVLIHT